MNQRASTISANKGRGCLKTRISKSLYFSIGLNHDPVTKTIPQAINIIPHLRVLEHIR